MLNFYVLTEAPAPCHLPPIIQVLVLESVKMCVVFASKAVLFEEKVSQAELIGICETVTAEFSIKDAAKTLQDSELLATILCTNFITKQCKYHHSRNNTFVNRAHRILSLPIAVQPRSEAASRHTGVLSMANNYNAHCVGW